MRKLAAAAALLGGLLGVAAEGERATAWVDALYTAVRSNMRDTAWMQDPQHCAVAVNRTLQGLDDEYLHPNVGAVLKNACEHSNVYMDFGGHTSKCTPLFVDLGTEFEGVRDYATWCQEASSLIEVGGDHARDQKASAGASAGASGGAGGAAVGVAPISAGGAAQRKKDKIARATQELKKAKAKQANGEDIQKDLKRIRKLVKEAETDAEAARAAKTEVEADKAAAEAAAERSAASASDAESAAAAAGTAADEAAVAPAEGQGAKDLRVGDATWGSQVPDLPFKSTKPGAVKRGAGHGGKPGYPFGTARLPFGQEAHAQKFTKDSIHEGNAMVDQIEKAQVAEEKRATYRALTHLRGMMSNTYDATANTHMQNIVEYNKKNHWREQHPVNHLADEESDYSTWAYPQ